MPIPRTALTSSERGAALAVTVVELRRLANRIAQFDPSDKAAFRDAEEALGILAHSFNLLRDDVLTEEQELARQAQKPRAS